MDKTLLHAVRASEASVAVTANREAVDYLAVAFGCVSTRTSRDACVRSRLEELAGDSLEALANHDEAIVRYLVARRRWMSPMVRSMSSSALEAIAPIQDPAARESELCWKVGQSAERGRSAYLRALRWLDKADAVLPPDHGALAARILITKCVALARLGRFDESLQAGEAGVALARADGDAELLAYAYSMLTHPLFGLGLLDKAIAACTEALASYEQIGDLAGQGSSHGNLAACYQLTGDLHAALEHHELSLALHSRLGYTTGVAITRGNLGELLLQMGDTETALENLQEAVGYRADQGVPPSLTGFACINLSRARMRLGDLESAELALSEGRGILRGIDAKGLLLDAGVLDAELRLAGGDLEGAQEACERVLGEAEALGADMSQAQALCVLGSVRIAQGLPGDAVPGLQACVSLAAKTGSDYERAQALAVLAEARAACADGDEQACEDELGEAIGLFRRMGAGYDLERAEALRTRLRLAEA